MNTACEHINTAKNAEPKSDGCDACLAMGDSWVHLRLCLACGNVGCCDSSKNKHASMHFRQTRHPVIRSFQPGEDWRWCFVDEVMG